MHDAENLIKVDVMESIMIAMLPEIELDEIYKLIPMKGQIDNAKKRRRSSDAGEEKDLEVVPQIEGLTPNVGPSPSCVKASSLLIKNNSTSVVMSD